VRKLLVSTAASVMIAGGVIGVPASVAGASVPPKGKVVTYQFTGSSTFDQSTPACDFVHQTYDANVTINGVLAQMHLDGCVTNTLPYPYDGTFTITEGRRSQMTGTVDGLINNGSAACTGAGGDAALDFTLTVSTATGKFSGVNGTVHLLGDWCSSGTPNVVDPVSGTLSRGGGGALP
jgi:hypothetical protein